MEWFATPQGRYVLDWELTQFDRAAEDVFGYRAVQMGLHQIDFLRANRIPFRFTLALEHGATLSADPMQLPLANQSVDLVVLPHALESTADPHLVLREAERVLMPEGQLVISGFNPLSLWRLRQMFASRGAGAPWDERFIGLLRLNALSSLCISLLSPPSITNPALLFNLEELRPIFVPACPAGAVGRFDHI